MSGQLSMFGPETCEDSPNAIFSAGLESGATPCASPDGLTIGQSGPLPVRASRSPRRASGRAPRTRGTFGQRSLASWKGFDLSCSLASRLRVRTDSLGSTLFRMTWSDARTSQGRSLPRLAASAHPMIVNGFIGVPWPTPQRATSPTLMHRERSDGGQPNLPWAARLVAWLSPQARDWRSGETGEGPLEHNARPLSEVAILAGWSTATVNDARSGANATASRNPDSQHHDGWTLVDLATLCGWATPAACDATGTTGGGQCTSLRTQARLTDSGPDRIGYLLGPSGWEVRPASGQLSPHHSRWLMALPEEWCEAAIAASRSLKAKKRGRSGSADTETES